MLIVFPKTKAVEPNDLIRLSLGHNDYVSFRMKQDYVMRWNHDRSKVGVERKDQRSRLAQLISSGHGQGDVPGFVVPIGDTPWGNNLHLLPLASASFTLDNDRCGHENPRYERSVDWNNDKHEWTTNSNLGDVVKLDDIDQDRNGNIAHGKIVGIRSLIAALLTQFIELPYNFIAQNFDHVNINFPNAKAEKFGGRNFGKDESRTETFVRVKGQWFVVTSHGASIDTISLLKSNNVEIVGGRVQLADGVPTFVYELKTLEELLRRSEMYINMESDRGHWGADEKDIKSLARGTKSRRWLSLDINFPTETDRYSEEAAVEMFNALGISEFDHYDETTFTSYGSIDGSTVLEGKHDFGVIKTMGIFFREDIIKADEDANTRDRFYPGAPFKENLLSIDPDGISDVDIKRICRDWRIRTMIDNLNKDPKRLKDLDGDNLDDLLNDADDYESSLFNHEGGPTNDENSIKISEIFKTITEQRVVYIPIITPRIGEEASNQLAHLYERRMVSNMIEDNRFHFQTMAAMKG